MLFHIQQRLKALPSKPGVYLFKNRQGNVLYVGKAKALNKRVTSYFRANAGLNAAKQLMLGQIETIDWIAALTEADALVLEDRLIKDYQPRFNILAKDDKSFLYLHITAEDFPQVRAVRRPNLYEPGTYYGPYPFAHSLKAVLHLLHKIFPYRTCSGVLPHKACLEYYLHNCIGPCRGNISKVGYQQLLNQIIDVFEGRSAGFVQQLEERMRRAAQQHLFEQAAHLRDQIKAFKKLQSLHKTPQQYLADYYKNKSLDPQQGLTKLAKALGLAQVPKRIEVYDISNIQGQYNVGSMIVFIDGLPEKREYRRFKIKTVAGPNDLKSLREVVQRRLQREGWLLPDLVIMDGGKGQLSVAQDLWANHQVPVAALAKKREELYLPNQAIPITLPVGSQELFLVQRLRDEAHRFAISYYRLLHSKALKLV